MDTVNVTVNEIHHLFHDIKIKSILSCSFYFKVAVLTCFHLNSLFHSLLHSPPFLLDHKCQHLRSLAVPCTFTRLQATLSRPRVEMFPIIIVITIRIFTLEFSSVHYQTSNLASLFVSHQCR